MGKLLDKKDKKLVNNFREEQAVNGRVITLSSLPNSTSFGIFAEDPEFFFTINDFLTGILNDVAVKTEEANREAEKALTDVQKILG